MPYKVDSFQELTVVVIINVFICSTISVDGFAKRSILLTAEKQRRHKIHKVYARFVIPAKAGIHSNIFN